MRRWRLTTPSSSGVHRLRRSKPRSASARSLSASKPAGSHATWSDRAFALERSAAGCSCDEASVHAPRRRAAASAPANPSSTTKCRLRSASDTAVTASGARHQSACAARGLRQPRRRSVSLGCSPPEPCSATSVGAAAQSTEQPAENAS
eukprot:scaffold30769_cov71-Phaeocystis_antarctica.AAC.6